MSFIQWKVTLLNGYLRLNVCFLFLGFTASTATNPIWLIKTRLQLDRAPGTQSLNIRKCIQKIHQDLVRNQLNQKWFYNNIQWITKKTHTPCFSTTFFPYISGTAWAPKIYLHIFISVFEELSAGTRIFQIRWHNLLILAKTLIFQ